MTNNLDQYFATLGSKELVEHCNGLIEKFVQFTLSSELAERWRRNYHFYYNRSNTMLTGWQQSGENRGISFDGENGELTKINVNQFRNILLHVKNMITSQKPAFNARSVNTSAQAQTKAKLANNILDYVMRDKDLERRLTDAVEHSLIFDAGYVMATWDFQEGETTQLDLNDLPVQEGDIRFSNPTAWDVFFDPKKLKFEDNRWVIIRSMRNKWELMAQYPDLADQIAEVSNDKDRTYETAFDDVCDDDIPVYEFFHKKIPSTLPEGRYVMFCGTDIALQDMALPYTELPIVQVTAGQDLASQFGYSMANDLAALQEAYNMEYSTIMTNHNTFGVQNIVAPREAEVKVQELSGGTNLIEYNVTNGGGRPEGINFAQTPPEIFNMLDHISHDMETISGINSVIRGNPEASLQSGAALALVQNQAIAYMNHLQSSYTRLIERIGTLTIRIYQNYATTDRVVSISGKNNKTASRTFNGSDLDGIKQVVVESGNPLSKTLAGRIELAQQLVQTGLIKDPEQYLTVVETGQLDLLTEHASRQLDCIRRENEDLFEGIGARAVMTDDHRLHILEHTTLLSDPYMRSEENQELLNNVLSHMQEHMDFLMDPAAGPILQLLGQQSLAQPEVDPAVDPALQQDPAQMETAPGQSEAQLPDPAEQPPTAEERL